MTCDRTDIFVAMQGHGRNFGPSRNNRHHRLKSIHQLPLDRFGELERGEVAGRLEKLADVRASVVARGRALIANPRYPDKKTMKQVSLLLAAKLRF